MKRRLFNLAALLSLILCLGCLFMWVRSGFISEAWEEVRTDGARLGCHSICGVVYLYQTRFVPPLVAPPPPTPDRYFVPLEPPTPPRTQRYHEVRQRLPRPRWSWYWPWYGTSKQDLGTGQFCEGRGGTLPYWFATLASGSVPAIWFWQRRKEKRLRGRRGFEVEVKQEAAS